MDLSKSDGSSRPAGYVPADDDEEIAIVEKPGARKRRDADDASAVVVPTAAAWAKVLERLRKQLGEDVYSSWFARVEFEAGDAASVMLSVPTRFLKSWIHGNYRDKLVDLWLAEGYTIRRIDILVRTAVRPRAEVGATVAASEPEPRERPAPTMLAHAKAVAEAPKRPPNGGPLGGSPVDPRCSFDTFCEGTANRVALAAARSVADGAAAASFNPLFLHAGVGRGKSHLLHAIAQASRGGHSGRNVVYLTAEHFMFRFVAAIRNQSGVAFKESLREIDVLLIDDVQFLQGKSAQQEFCHLLNVLIDGARQVVVAADRPPAELESLDERVRSRLGGGVAFEIGSPDLDLRRRILRTRLAAAKEISPNLDIPETVIDYVAQTVATNGRDLEGALNRLVAQWQFTNAPITIPSAEVTLRDLIGTREPRRVRIEDIQKVVSRHFNVSKADLLSSRRTRTIVRPRQIAMYLSKAMTPRSLPEIGRRFGGRDHTTVLHAVRKIEELMAGDRGFGDEVELLRKMVEDQPIP
ncbi:MAG: chromosomal replication initiator protein DnaA [Bauldia sp.]|nr:chromosomal replication initiator protein DnaA [Bauldia sp.]